MKKSICVVLLVAMLLTLPACGSKPDPNCGVYEARIGTVDGITVSVQQVYENGFSVELKDGGKAVLKIDGEDYRLTWKCEGDRLTIEAKDTSFHGTLSEGMMVLEDFNGSGIDFTLICKELFVSSSMSDYWDGRWYGWEIVFSGWGEYAGSEDMAMDVVSDIVVSGKTGVMNIWYFGSSEDELIMNANFRLEEGSTSNGKMVVQSGSVFGMALEDGALEIDPGESSVKSLDHMIEIRGIFTDPENAENGFEYLMFLRPWGMTWEDVENAESEDFLYGDMMPGSYEEYLVEIGVLDKVEEDDSEDVWEDESGEEWEWGDEEFELDDAESGIFFDDGEEDEGATETDEP